MGLAEVGCARLCRTSLSLPLATSCALLDFDENLHVLALALFLSAGGDDAYTTIRLRLSSFAHIPARVEARVLIPLPARARAQILAHLLGSSLVTAVLLGLLLLLYLTCTCSPASATVQTLHSDQRGCLSYWSYRRTKTWSPDFVSR